MSSHCEAGVEPVGGAVLVLHPLTQAGPRGADVLARPLTGEDPLVQTAGGQDMFLIHPTERQTEGQDSRLTFTPTVYTERTPSRV